MKWQASLVGLAIVLAGLWACSSSGGKKGGRAAAASSTATATSTAKKTAAKPKSNKQTSGGDAACLAEECADQPSDKGDDGGDISGEDDSSETDTSTATATDDGLDDGNSGVADAADPDKAYFASILNPEQKETCHTQGMPFRDQGDGGVNSGTGGRCYEGATYPPAYSCDRAGIASVSDSPELKAALDQLEGEGWYIDDCGVFNQKPIILLACYTAGDDVCRKIEDIDNKTLVIKSKVIKLGG